MSKTTDSIADGGCSLTAISIPSIGGEQVARRAGLGPPRRERLQSGAPEANFLRRDQRRAHVELDLRMAPQRYVAWVGLVDLTVIERGHLALGRADLVGAKRLVPNIEEIAEGVSAL